MARISYTITSITKRCPHCKGIIDETSHGDFTPLYGIVFFFTFPFAIPYLIIRYWLLRNPDSPKVGEEVIDCPHWSMQVRTDRRAKENLDEEDLFLHKFKKWAYLSYAIGAIFGFCVLALLVGEPIVSLYGLCALLSFVVVAVIIISYHVKYKRIMGSWT